jgi:hypothetical protein
MTNKSLTDGRTDDSTKSIGHIFQKCALKIFDTDRVMVVKPFLTAFPLCKKSLF